MSILRILSTALSGPHHRVEPMGIVLVDSAGARACASDSCARAARGQRHTRARAHAPPDARGARAHTRARAARAHTRARAARRQTPEAHVHTRARAPPGHTRAHAPPDARGEIPTPHAPPAATAAVHARARSGHVFADRRSARAREATRSPTARSARVCGVRADRYACMSLTRSVSSEMAP